MTDDDAGGEGVKMEFLDDVICERGTTPNECTLQGY